MYTLIGEDPDLTAGLEHLRALGEADGIFTDTADFGGTRTEADTEKILRYRDQDYLAYVKALAVSHPGKKPAMIEIWRPIAPFGLSLHNWGCARDLKILKKPDSFSEAEAYRRLGVHAKECGLQWGGTFKKKVDFPHFQLPITVIEARARWERRHHTSVVAAPAVEPPPF